MQSKKKLLYIEIYQKLKFRILSSHTLYHLPPERFLAKEFNVSRVTIRHALKLLSEEQLIEKKTNSASFIKPNIFTHNLLQAESLKEEFETVSKNYSIDILSFTLIPSPPHITELLNITPEQKVYFITRLIYSDDIPLIYEESFLPENLFPNMKKSDTIVKYDYIEHDRGMKIKCVHKKLSAIIPETHIKNILQLSRQPVLHFDIQAELENGIICEYVQQYYHPKYTFIISSYRQ